MKIKFESNNDLPLGEIINISVCVTIAKSVFQENDKCFFEYEHKYEDNFYAVS